MTQQDQSNEMWPATSSAGQDLGIEQVLQLVLTAGNGVLLAAALGCGGCECGEGLPLQGPLLPKAASRVPERLHLGHHASVPAAQVYKCKRTESAVTLSKRMDITSCIVTAFQLIP